MDNRLRSAEELLALFGRKYSGLQFPREVLASKSESYNFCCHVRHLWRIDADDEVILEALEQAAELIGDRNER